MINGFNLQLHRVSLTQTGGRGTAKHGERVEEEEEEEEGEELKLTISNTGSQTVVINGNSDHVMGRKV